MSEYHKIQSVFKRKLDGDRTLIEGEWSLPEFGYLADNRWTFTEKVNGTNIRVIFKHGGVQYGGKTDNAQIPTKLYAHLRDTFGGLRGQLDDAVLYGEGHGPGIQKGGGNYGDKQSFVLFDVRISGWWLKREDVEDVAKQLKLDVVPIIGEGTLYDAVEIAKRGLKSRWGDFQAEGIVARPRVELSTRGGERLITKVKRKDFVARP